MKKTIYMMAILSTVLAAVAAPVQAADVKHMMPIAEAMADNDAPGRLGDSVKFFFGNQPTPKILVNLGNGTTSQKTNSFGKSNEKACNWVFLSNMLALQKRAHKLGANAVVNIVSNYGRVENSSTNEFECHVGAVMAGVAFKADFVKIADK
jgi:uncharacterized protein YbjQ (UPF0145 family)